MTIQGPVEWVVLLGSVVAAIVAIVGIVQRWAISPAARSLRETIREELAPLQTAVEDVRREVTYNGGTSLKDAVRRTEDRVTKVESEVETVIRMMAPPLPPHSE